MSASEERPKSHWFQKPHSAESNHDYDADGNKAGRKRPHSSWGQRFSPSYWSDIIKDNLKPHKTVKGNPTFAQSIKAVVSSTWLNVLLIFIPVSWALHFVLSDKDSGPVVKFVTAFLAIIPLAKLLGVATEELALRVGQTLGGLLNATLGNAVELIVAIIACVKCELRIVQSSLVGSILSNLLLVLGMCFFAGGTRFSEQGFAAAASQLNSSLLVVSVIAVLLPGAFHITLNSSTDPSVNTTDEGPKILAISRGVAIILLVTYGAYLVFQLWSHSHLYADDSEDNFKSRKFPKSPTVGDTGTSSAHSSATEDKTGMKRTKMGEEMFHENGEKSTLHLNPPGAEGGGDIENQRHPDEQEEDEDEEVPQMSTLVAIATLTAVTVLVAVTAEFLVDSIDALTDEGGVSKEFVGLVLLPIVGNAAEHVTAVTVSVKDKLTLSLGVAAGSSIQIALFVIPFMVVLAWIIGKPLTLLFDPFESITLFLAVITVNYVTADGRTNWLEGLILMNLYVIIALTFWYYPGSDPSGVLEGCH